MRTVNRADSGFSLIELMVVLVIGLVLTLAIFGILSTNESKKRTTTSVSDIDQSGAYSMYAIDKLVRSAGSGFTQFYAESFGCLISASVSGTAILPSTYMPTDFSPLQTNALGPKAKFRVAPILIAGGLNLPPVSNQLSAHPSDYLITLSGNAGFGELPTLFAGVPVSPPGGPASLPLANSVAFNPNDLVLLMDINNPTTTALAPCTIDQVAPAYVAGTSSGTLNLGGVYDNPATITNAAYTAGGAVADLGPSPQFTALGIGANNTLESYDLLQLGSTGINTVASAPVVISDGVFEMHALYGIAVTPGTLSWVRADQAPWRISDLSTNTAANAALLKTIVAIRIALIMRSALPEKATVPSVTPGPIVLFNGVTDVNGASVTITRTLTGVEQNYRYRTFESIIPLRNPLL